MDLLQARGSGHSQAAARGRVLLTIAERSRISRDAVIATRDVVRPYLRLTPTVEVDAEQLGLSMSPLTLKLELLQHAGSFKTRGAFTNLLTRVVPSPGVVAASGGNHGAAVAYAAQRLRIPATIFVPRVSSPAKTSRITGYGARLVVEGDSYSDALAASQAFARGSGAMEIHAFDQDETILGQGTLGLELQEQAPTLHTVLAGVGGGGLLAGITAAYDERTRIVGVEPESAPTLTRALEAGHPVDAPVGGIAVDSLAPRRVGERVLAVVRDRVRVVLVPDAAIAAAMRTLWDVLRIVAEPGGAAAFAAVAGGYYRPASGERVGIVISGGNTVAVDFARVSS